HIQYGHIRPQRRNPGQGRRSGPRLAHHDDVLLSFQQFPDAPADDLVIIEQEYLDRLSIVWRLLRLRLAHLAPILRRVTQPKPNHFTLAVPRCQVSRAASSGQGRGSPARRPDKPGGGARGGGDGNTITPP